MSAEERDGWSAEAVSPLSGVRVLDLTGRIGAYCSKMLADLGADVLKVELPSGDKLRHVPPFSVGSTGSQVGLLFSYYHHNKRGITLDWRRDAAEPLLAELSASAQVVLASPRGERERVVGYSHDPSSLSWMSSDSLVCFITPFGLSGPYRDWRATPFTAFAMSGRMHPVGPEEGPPIAMPGQVFYDEAGAWAAFLIQAALRGPVSLRTQVIDQSVHEVGLFYEMGQPPFTATGSIRSRVTNFGAPPSGIWRCGDRWVDIACHTEQHWEVFLDVVGRPEPLIDPIYRDRAMRIQLFDLLTEIIVDILADRDARELVESGQSAGLPCALTQTAAQFLGEEQARSRGFFIRTQPADVTSFEIPGAPFVSTPRLIDYRMAAPRLGEANRQVYVDELGHSEQDLEIWQSDGLI